MSELLNTASAAMGIPEALVQRSAAARATEAGMSVDDVLSAWGGGGAVPAAAAAAPPAAEATAEIADESVAPTPDEPAAPAIEVPAQTTPAQPAGAPSRAPLPTEVTSREAARLPEVITVPTAGIRERTNSTIPRWLITVLLAAPLFALFALGGLATGECGEGTELRTDVVTGQIVNCDGSEFTGSGGPGEGGFNFVALGERIYQGTEVGGVNCYSCHGRQGEGLGTFPGMGGVTTTFSSCTDHIEWVTLGAAGFRQTGRDTYGDTQRPVNLMPAFGGSLSEDQIAAVVAYERVNFSGADPADVAVDCGFAEPDDGEVGEPNDDDETGEASRSGRDANS